LDIITNGIINGPFCREERATALMKLADYHMTPGVKEPLEGVDKDGVNYAAAASYFEEACALLVVVRSDAAPWVGDTRSVSSAC